MLKKITPSGQFIILGIVFAMFWSSASVAAKIGVRTMEPLMLFQFRFFLASILLLTYSFFFEKWRMPSRTEFKALAVFGFLNITLYLSLFVLAIKEVAAGIGSLSVSLGPLLMSIIGGLFLGKKIKAVHVFGLVLGVAGVGLAVSPLLQNSFASVRGLIYLFISMISYSIASIYFAEKTWTLPRFSINGWQVLIGGILMLPFTLFLKEKPVVFNLNVVYAILWLAIPVSLLSVNLWLRLLKIDSIKASFFLFLSPIFGFIYSSIILSEPFTWHTLIGLMLVLFGLFLGQKK